MIKDTSALALHRPLHALSTRSSENSRTAGPAERGRSHPGPDIGRGGAAHDHPRLLPVGPALISDKRSRSTHGRRTLNAKAASKPGSRYCPGLPICRWRRSFTRHRGSCRSHWRSRSRHPTRLCNWRNSRDYRSGGGGSSGARGSLKDTLAALRSHNGQKQGTNHEDSGQD